MKGVTTRDVARIRELRAKGLSFARISQMTGFSGLTCRRWADDKTYQHLLQYKRDYLDKKRNPLLYVRTIPLGPGGWPKEAQIFSRRDESTPVFVFTRNGPRRKWVGHEVSFGKLTDVKRWALSQPEFLNDPQPTNPSSNAGAPLPGPLNSGDSPPAEM